jgi:cleavage and polyadenylation specificity factor subunit 2
MNNKGAGIIRATPLAGGRSDKGVCTLLEVGEYRVLLDCGATLPIDYDYFENLTEKLVNDGGIDAIILSHADLRHIGALPILLGRKGLLRDHLKNDSIQTKSNESPRIPIICTLPVHKFSLLTLYDFVLNQQMEGEGVDPKQYNLDDVDLAFKTVQEVKFNQSFQLRDYLQSLRTKGSSASNQTGTSLSVTALASGRTVGGSIWRIKCGPAEVLYSVDVNLKKEIVIDPLSLDSLPSSPALMICEAYTPPAKLPLANSAGAAVASSSVKKRKDKDRTDDQLSQFLGSLTETLRGGGNVLVPVETSTRLFELLQILEKHWSDNKFGIYHLVLLSHMSFNLMDFIQSQLEWMTSNLTRDFYHGKGNPFELNYLKTFSNVRTMEKKCSGPKLVLATDSSLSYGLAKELLLKWGQDKRSKVIFVDSPSTNQISPSNSSGNNLLTKSTATNSSPTTLGYELRRLAAFNPPVITTITVPTRVSLGGQELVNYRQDLEKKKKAIEEEIFRKKRQEEISKFKMLNNQEMNEEDDENDEIGADGSGKNGKFRLLYTYVFLRGSNSFSFVLL